MQAIEFETIAQGHTIRVPDTVPDGVRLRVLLLLDEHRPGFAEPPPGDSVDGEALKALLAAMPDVGDTGREAGKMPDKQCIDRFIDKHRNLLLKLAK